MKPTGLIPEMDFAYQLLHDKAFDAGIITVAENMTVCVSQKIWQKGDSFFASALLTYDGQPIGMPEKFVSAAELLAYHRNAVFENG